MRRAAAAEKAPQLLTEQLLTEPCQLLCQLLCQQLQRMLSHGARSCSQSASKSGGAAKEEALTHICVERERLVYMRICEDACAICEDACASVRTHVLTHL